VFPYWLLLAAFAMAAFTESPRSPGVGRANLSIILLFLFMALMIGLRFQVGGDYGSYERIFDLASDASLSQALERGDPGYQFLNWLVGQWDGKMWQVNLICGAIFAWGLARLCLIEPAPKLAALIAIPYLVVVVAMGYTRQAVAIGFIMAGIAALYRGGSIIRFVFYVALAALFHRTAIIMLPLAIFAGKRNYFLNAVAIVAAAYGLYSALLEESVEGLVAGYIDTRYASQGAGIRVAMNVMPAILLLVAGRRLGLDEYQRRFWSLVAIAALLCVPALFLVPSTTAVDRIALYLIPIQIIAIGRSIYLFRSHATARLWIIIYCAAVLFVWLNFASHAFAWIPYRSVIEWE
jgi:hypothetical protein